MRVTCNDEFSGSDQRDSGQRFLINCKLPYYRDVKFRGVYTMQTS